LRDLCDLVRKRAYTRAWGIMASSRRVHGSKP